MMMSWELAAPNSSHRNIEESARAGRRRYGYIKVGSTENLGLNDGGQWRTRGIDGDAALLVI